MESVREGNNALSFIQLDLLQHPLPLKLPLLLLMLLLLLQLMLLLLQRMSQKQVHLQQVQLQNLRTLVDQVNNQLYQLLLNQCS